MRNIDAFHSAADSNPTSGQSLPNPMLKHRLIDKGENWRHSRQGNAVEAYGQRRFLGFKMKNPNVAYFHTKTICWSTAGLSLFLRWFSAQCLQSLDSRLLLENNVHSAWNILRGYAYSHLKLVLNRSVRKSLRTEQNSDNRQSSPQLSVCNKRAPNLYLRMGSVPGAACNHSIECVAGSRVNVLRIRCIVYQYEGVWSHNKMHLLRY